MFPNQLQAVIAPPPPPPPYLPPTSPKTAYATYAHHNPSFCSKNCVQSPSSSLLFLTQSPNFFSSFSNSHINW
ncbi:hypothetical protein HanLR1_Chr13g0493921 [Helianthus annuus]|nr:hypothetical protein HanHA89_Chr13g0523931 [Helianthus annuus]KAJ0664568.1 hypothetical protein HanLR1_Chr13g0493921 [Helianthus annuus]